MEPSLCQKFADQAQAVGVGTQPRVHYYFLKIISPGGTNQRGVTPRWAEKKKAQFFDESRERARPKREQRSGCVAGGRRQQLAGLNVVYGISCIRGVYA